MRLFSSWRSPGSASLLTTTVLIWFGAFLLCWAASGSEVYAAPTMAGAPHAEQAANEDGGPLDDYYLAAFAAEGKAEDKLPRNAVLLRTLVFMLFFGLALGWLLASDRMRCRLEVCSPIRCWFHIMVHLYQRRAVVTLLGVFRL